MSGLPLAIEEHATPRPQQDIGQFCFSANEMINLLGQFDPYGAWIMDLETGRVSWSRDAYEIHGMEPTDGHVDLNAAIRAYHPDDRKIVAQMIDETIENRSGFRYVLRIQQAGGSYKLVKCTARYRVNRDGREEIFGLFSQFQPPIRMIATSST